MFSKKKQNISLLLFCIPALAVFIIFKLYPAVAGLVYSMTNWNGLSKSFDFIGLENFAELLTDDYFWDSAWFTVKYVLVLLVVSNVIALALAVAVESVKKGKGFFRTLFVLPNMLSMIIGGYMWRFIFYKVLYYMADNWGWKFLDKSWVGDTKYAFLSIIIVAAWGCVGYLMIIYMTGLQNVPANLKEAAALDGANGWQKFWNVTFPLMRSSMTICLFWSLNSAFQVFDVIYSLTGGGPGRATQSVAVNIYEEAFKGNIRYGYATAKSMVLFLIILVITAIQLNTMKSKEEEL